MSLTRLEAVERAEKIWGPPILEVSQTQEGGAEVLIAIRRGVMGDGRHFLDKNGHAICHKGCTELEEQAYPTPTSLSMEYRTSPTKLGVKLAQQQKPEVKLPRTPAALAARISISSAIGLYLIEQYGQSIVTWPEEVVNAWDALDKALDADGRRESA